MKLKSTSMDVYSETFSNTFEDWNIQFPGLDAQKVNNDNLHIRDGYGRLLEVKLEAKLTQNTERAYRSLEYQRTREEQQPELYHLKVLEHQMNNLCATMTKDYWNYEWCFGKRISQFHLEQKGNVFKKNPDWSLGKFVRRRAEYNTLTEGQQKKQKHPTIKKIVEIYEDGQHCDETGKGRKSEVHIQCCEGKICEKTLNSI